MAKAFIDNPENKPFVNHIDKDNSNNNVENLRWSDRIEISLYATKRRGNKSGHKGVFYCKKSNKWIANVAGKRIGTFDDKDMAIKVRKRNVLFEHGEYMNE